MTYGIDVSAGQTGLNFKTAKSEGLDFAIVKASGFNTGSLYVADNYQKHVDNARNAGLGGYGHYYIPGRGDVLRQAEWFATHLHGFDVRHDVLALDNEPLDANAVYWKQGDAFKFLAAVQAHTKIDWNRLWFYAPASLTRTNSPWNLITDRGIRVWWSAYGAQPTGHTPDHTPELQGKIARWDVHQFTDQTHIAGFSVDGNYSHLSTAQLFNHVTTPTSTTPKPSPTPAAKPGEKVVSAASGNGWAFNLPDTALTVRIQRALGRRNRYHGPANGRFTIDTAKAVQLTIENVGYTGAIDGKIQGNGCHYIQLYAQKFGSYKGAVDNKLATYSWTGFALGLERP